MALALGFYAQFESGLPAYALTVLDVDESAIGLAAAVNCVVIVALQVVVVRVTARRNAASLLMVVGAVWTLSWVVLSAAQLAPEIASALFVTTFGIFAVGETMYAPVLNPLTASLAPQGLVGTTLGTFTAIQTTFSALGPLVAGALLGHGPRERLPRPAPRRSASPPSTARGACAPPCVTAAPRSAARPQPSRPVARGRRRRGRPSREPTLVA